MKMNNRNLKTENEIVGGEPDESEVPPEKKVKEYELTR